MNHPKTIGQRLAELIDERNVSAKKVSDATNVSTSTLSDLLTGKRLSVSSDTAISLAKYFGVTVDYLFGLTECKSIEPDYQITEKTTGLNKASIKTLIERPDFSDLINTLLNTANGIDVIDRLRIYLHMDEAMFYSMKDGVLSKVDYDLYIGGTSGSIYGLATPADYALQFSDILVMALDDLREELKKTKAKQTD